MKSCEPNLQREISTHEPAKAERRGFFDKPSLSPWRLCLSALLCGTAFVSDIVVAQTQIPIPAQSSTFSTNSRGFWFTSPSNIVITGVRVPTDASSGPQSAEIVRFNTAAPPIYSATTNDFTSLLRVVDDATTNILPTSIPVATGDIIGVLGSRSNVNSYASGAPLASTIDGLPVNLSRLGMQFPLSSTAAQQLWTETGGSISRVELYYLPGFLVSTAASPLAGGTVTCAVNVVATGGSTTCTATPNAGYSLTNISGCNGTTSTTSPYTTGTVTAACTVTATFSNALTIGGSVSGLSGTGLVLSLNAGAQTLNVAANGSFTFPTGLSSGSPYAVTVQTQPSAPAQVCTVANGAGSVSNANVTNVSVTCATAQRSVSVISSGAAFTTSPTIPASVPDGTVLTFTIVMPSGAQLQSVTGCGGSLNGSVYTTGPITANCTINVFALTPAIPTLNNALLLLLAVLLAVVTVMRQRRTPR